MKGKPTLKERLILEATPRDEWIKANKIADKTGLTTQAVGSIIGYNLLEFIERKRFSDSSNRFFYINALNSARFGARIRGPIHLHILSG